MNKKKKLKLKIAALSLAATQLVTLAGCSPETTPDEDYDIIKNDASKIGNGIIQELEVKGQDFKLISEITCDDSSKRNWRITSDKFLDFKVYTKGLPEDMQVYIDNVHVDATVKSLYAAMDGTIQDSMDDHVHSSKVTGFAIDDQRAYYGTDNINGCNQEFIQGTYYASNGMGFGSTTTKRYTENDYLEYGVYGNKISVVYDLLIKNKKEEDFCNVSVKTDFIVQLPDSELLQDEFQKAQEKAGKVIIKK